MDLNEPAPPVQETIEQAAIQQRAFEAELARLDAMPKLHGPSLGPGGPGGGPGGMPPGQG